MLAAQGTGVLWKRIQFFTLDRDVNASTAIAPGMAMLNRSSFYLSLWIENGCPLPFIVVDTVVQP